MQVKIDRKPEKIMARFPKHITTSLIVELLKLKDFPNVKMDIKKLGKDVYRLRLGEYRALFKVGKEKDIILVVEINTRGKISYAKS